MEICPPEKSKKYFFSHFSENNNTIYRIITDVIWLNKQTISIRQSYSVLKLYIFPINKSIKNIFVEKQGALLCGRPVLGSNKTFLLLLLS